MDYDYLKTLAQILSLLSLPIALIAFLRTQNAQSTDRTNKLTDRLYELDKLIIQNPRLQELLFQNVNFSGQYFHPDTPHTPEYFQLKTFIYYYLNFFDEIFTSAADNSHLIKRFELADWQTYIFAKMRHPLFKELFEKESHHYGESFRSFINKNKDELAKAPDPEAF
jgi:hypothetical protein